MYCVSVMNSKVLNMENIPVSTLIDAGWLCPGRQKGKGIEAGQKNIYFGEPPRKRGTGLGG